MSALPPGIPGVEVRTYRCDDCGSRHLHRFAPCCAPQGPQAARTTEYWSDSAAPILRDLIEACPRCIELYRWAVRRKPLCTHPQPGPPRQPAGRPMNHYLLLLDGNKVLYMQRRGGIRREGRAMFAHHPTAMVCWRIQREVSEAEIQDLLADGLYISDQPWVIESALSPTFPFGRA